MRRRGADCPVVALKRGNARGGKGAVHRHWVGATGNGRNLTINGRRQPSRGGTSRMMREYHVRICEGLGVKFPGPTRQIRTPALRKKIKKKPFHIRHAGGAETKHILRVLL